MAKLQKIVLYERPLLLKTLLEDKFEFHGDALHLKITSFEDLEYALDMKEVHWLTTTAPCSDFILPAQFLSWLDSDGDGRIRVEEVESAIRWLRDSSSCIRPQAELSSGDLKDPDLQEAWSKIVRVFELKKDTKLSLKLLKELKDSFVDDPASKGSGSLSVEDLSDSKLKELVSFIQEAVEPDTESVTEEQLDLFLSKAKKVIQWRGQSPGEDVWADHYAVYKPLAKKFEQYFLLSDTAEFTGKPAELEWPDPKDGSIEEQLRALPLTRPNDSQVLKLDATINPVYREQVQSFIDVFPELENSELTRLTYKKLSKRFEQYAGWLDLAPDLRLTNISTEQLQRWVEDEKQLSSLREQLKRKRSEGLVVADFEQLQKLLLFQSHLLNFCRNFISFPDLYNPKERALFERGTLIMDGKEFHLALPVDDIVVHKAAASRSNMFVLYIEVSKQTLAVPVTSGTKGYLAKGKRGVFNHVDGTEREALILDLVTNPISFYEAVLAPFQKIGGSIKSKFEAMSDEKEKQLVEKTMSTTTAEKSKSKSAASQGTLLAGGGVALAALGSSLAFVLKTLASMTPTKIVLGFLALFLAFFIPAAIVAYLKLRNRDLSSVLEGNGWGINDRMKLSKSQARQFTTSPPHPGRARSSINWLLGLIPLALLLAATIYLAYLRYPQLVTQFGEL